MPKEIDSLRKKGIDILKNSGAKIVDISLPHTKYALPTYYIVAPAEASSNLARYDGGKYGYRSDNHQNLASMTTRSRTEGFGDEVKRRILIGTYALSAGYVDAYYKKAQKANPKDKASIMYIDRCKTLKKQNPKDWNGVWVMTSK